MYKTITKCDFHDAFRAMGRGEQFTYEGLNALYDYLEDAYSDEYELDVVALCCEFSEYEDIKEVLEACEYIGAETIDDVKACTEVIEVSGGGYILRDF